MERGIGIYVLVDETVTGDSLRSASHLAGVKFAATKRCGTCMSPIGYAIIDRTPYISQDCQCGPVPPVPVDWDRIALEINAITHLQERVRLLRRFGVKIINGRGQEVDVSSDW